VPDSDLTSSYSREQVCRLLSITSRQLRNWEKNGLIRPASTFSLRDLIALRTLSRLCHDHVPPARIRAAVAAIRRRLRDVEDPLREMRIIADGKRIRVDLAGQPMEPLSGQLLFNFDGNELRKLLSFPRENRQEEETRNRREEAERWFQQGLRHEQTGSVKEAIQSYEKATEIDPRSAGAWVNLGTIYFNAKQFGRAESYYRRALDSDPTYALAHFNIGNLYDERADYERALHHYNRAVELNSRYADAHYNLALLHQARGHVMDAVRHWKTYLKLDPGSSWGVIARRELEKLRRSTLVRGSGLNDAKVRQPG
jgi:tetratricopeptide (TPR) repeat protein